LLLPSPPYSKILCVSAGHFSLVKLSPEKESSFWDFFITLGREKSRDRVRINRELLWRLFDSYPIPVKNSIVIKILHKFPKGWKEGREGKESGL